MELPCPGSPRHYTYPMPYHLAFLLAKTFPTAYGPYVTNQFDLGVTPNWGKQQARPLPVGVRLDTATQTAGMWAHSFGETIKSTTPRGCEQIRLDFHNGWKEANSSYSQWCLNA